MYDALLWKGIKEGLKIVLMVFGAFVILNLLRATGAIDEVKGPLPASATTRRVQVVIIGVMLPVLSGGRGRCRRTGRLSRLRSWWRWASTPSRPLLWPCWATPRRAPGAARA